MDKFFVKSNDLIHNNTLPNAQVYRGYGCNGGNISPHLSWGGAPDGTKSFAIICHDPDAPRQNGWYHWLVVNIPKNIKEIHAGGKIENSLETITDFGTSGYGGAAPPVGHGVHRYNFFVYALDIEKLDVNKDTLPVDVEKVVKNHEITHALITGLYERR